MEAAAAADAVTELKRRVDTLCVSSDDSKKQEVDESNQEKLSANGDVAAEDEAEKLRTLRIAFVGNVDSGKSSLIGTLIKGDLDDGRGLSRKVIFRHKHEEESGRTSSVATVYMGFEDSGEQILSKRAGKLIPWVELAKLAHKRIQLIDLAGHEKYLKTTVFGLTGMQPDIVVVVIGANMGVKRMTKEHLAIAVALEIPIVVALTKIDIAPKNVAKETLQTIRQSLRRYGKMAMLVKTLEQAETAAKSIPSNRITPILPLSNVTGDGLANLRRIFFEASPTALFKATLAATTLAMTKSNNQEEALATTADGGSTNTKSPTGLGDLIEMPIDETYQVPGVGFVVAGTLVSGTFKINDMLQIGPDHNGQFHKVTVRSMESMYIPLKEIVPGQTAAISLRSVNKRYALNRTTFRKGMILLSPQVNVRDYVSQTFDARVVILHHQTTVTKGYQPMINCRTIRQTAEIVSIESSQDVIRTGDRALVRFRFIHAPEFLKKGMRFVFRDGQAKGIGKVVRIVPPGSG
uniref:Elongation factor Tu, chloroplastic n=1 Tax=Globisporangium ultimum (strain ATCC 200006 / CBS 805.95 / DAOM BR144) TaxID=431595 RepID=K3W622_GLOUD